MGITADDVKELRERLSVRKPNYAVIAAVDADGGFAKDGKIPWHYTEDFQWFKAITSGSICVMGRNTYEEINNRLGDEAKESVLPKRRCFVLSQSMEPVENATVVRSVEELWPMLDKASNDLLVTSNFKPSYVGPVFFIGGGYIFEEAIKRADYVILTVINKSFECDAFFPTQTLLTNFHDIVVRDIGNPDLRAVIFKRN